MKDFIQKLLNNEDLNYKESYHLFTKLYKAPLEQQVAILILLRRKKECLAEIIGARDFFLQHAYQIKSPHNTIDIVGTGGDNIGTFNISTAASLVVASCGVPVSKHGGRGSNSLSGSMDVLECLGITPSPDAKSVLKSIEENNYAYLWAPLFNQQLRAFSALRKNLGSPTMFNIIGPLLNPMQPQYQVIGVYRKDLVLTVAELLKNSSTLHAIVVHSEDGLDEFSISAPSYIAILKNKKITNHTINPLDLGLNLAPLSELIGDGPKENAEIIKGILSGAIQGAKKDIVLLNSAAALLVSGKVTNLVEGLACANQAIVSGKTLNLLNTLKNGASYV